MKFIKKIFSFIIEIVNGTKQTKIEAREKKIGA
jgi:hypothetical protein